MVSVQKPNPGIPLAVALLLASVTVGLDGTATGDAASSSGEFALLAYNVNGLPPIIAAAPNPEHRNRLIGAFLNAYEVALVQEDFFYHNELVAQMEHPYPSTPGDPICFKILFFEFCFPGSDADGLNRFSDFPFGTVYEEAWIDCSLWEAFDCLTPKGFTVAETEIAPGVSVDVYNLHMDAGGSEGDRLARASQVEQLLVTINTRSDGRAVIVAGDTNLLLGRGTDSEEIPSDDVTLARLLAGAGLVDACEILEAGDCSAQIDRILYRSSGGVTLDAIDWYVDERFVDEDGKRLSDHPAIAARFAWAYEAPGD